MTDGTQAAFGLTRDPFGKELSTEAMWADPSRTQAVDDLLATVSNRRHALVTGEPGTGKTTVLRALRDKLSPVHFRTTYIAYVTLSPRDFTRQVCRALGIDVRATPAAMFEALQNHMGHLHREHRVHPVLVLDECHLMPDRTLSHLHVLANFDWDSAPLLSLVLVGLPELHDRLRLGIHRSLLTRLSAKVEVTPTSSSDTIDYVRKRMTDAGSSSDVFTPDGLAILHELSGGVLRSIDVLASAALRRAATQDVKLVDRQLVLHAYRSTPLA